MNTETTQPLPRLKDATRPIVVEMIDKRLEYHYGNVTLAAKTLGVGRATLYRMIRRMPELERWR